MKKTGTRDIGDQIHLLERTSDNTFFRGQQGVGGGPNWGGGRVEVRKKNKGEMGGGRTSGDKYVTRLGEGLGEYTGREKSGGGRNKEKEFLKTMHLPVGALKMSSKRGGQPCLKICARKSRGPHQKLESRPRGWGSGNNNGFSRLTKKIVQMGARKIKNGERGGLGRRTKLAKRFLAVAERPKNHPKKLVERGKVKTGGGNNVQGFFPSEEAAPGPKERGGGKEEKKKDKPTNKTRKKKNKEKTQPRQKKNREDGGEVEGIDRAGGVAGQKKQY